MPTPEDDRFVRPKEAAQLLGVSKYCFYTKILPQLAHYRPSPHLILIRQSELDAYVERHTYQPGEQS